MLRRASSSGLVQPLFLDCSELLQQAARSQSKRNRFFKTASSHVPYRWNDLQNPKRKIRNRGSLGSLVGCAHRHQGITKSPSGVDPSRSAL